MASFANRVSFLSTVLYYTIVTIRLLAKFQGVPYALSCSGYRRASFRLTFAGGQKAAAAEQIMFGRGAAVLTWQVDWRPVQKWTLFLFLSSQLYFTVFTIWHLAYIAPRLKKEVSYLSDKFLYNCQWERNFHKTSWHTATINVYDSFL